MRRRIELVAEGIDDAGLAHAGFAEHEEVAGATFGDDGAMRVEQHRELEIAADEAAQAGVIGEAIGARPRADEPIDLGARAGAAVAAAVAIWRAASGAGRGVAVGRQLDGVELLEAPVGARRAKDAAADEDLARHRLGGEAARDLRRLAEELVLELGRVAGAAGRAARDQRRAARQADRELERRRQIARDPIERVDERARKVDGAGGVVFGADGQPDDVGEAAIVEPIGMRRELIGDVLGDAQKIEQRLARARLAHVAAQFAQRRQLALDDDDALALGRLQQLILVAIAAAPDRSARHARGALGRRRRRRIVERRARRRAMTLGLGDHLRHQRGHRARLEDLALLRRQREEELPERAVQVARGLIAILGPLRQALGDDRLELVGDRWIDLAQRRHLRVLDRVERLFALEVPEERARAGQLPQDDPRGEDVAARIDRRACRLLGRHVRELAFDDAFFFLHVARARDAEVDQLHHPVPRDQDVLRRDVAMDDAERLAVFVGLAMRVVERLGDLLAEIRAQAEGNARVVLDGGVEQAQKVDAFDVLHGEEIGGADLSVAERLHDVRVVQVDGDLGLVLEHAPELGRLGERGMDLLDDQDLGEPLRKRLAREEDLGHSARAESPHQLIFSERFHECRGNVRPNRSIKRAPRE
ncbi:MAG TPA: hypothetical protein VGL86_08055 [Polyangia bacterium]